MSAIEISSNQLKIEDVVDVARNNREVSLSDEAIENIKKSAEIVQEAVKENKKIYGVTTGFGALKDKVISNSDVKKLQKNLIMSHSVGVGDAFSEEIVRAVMLLKIKTFAAGNSGVRAETVQMLVDMLNKNVHPYVPRQGSLGASGDLAPLAHMSLVLIGEGEAYFKGKLMKGKEALKEAGLKQIELEAKEGLALLNGTHVMAAIGALNVYDAGILSKNADMISAMSFDVLKGIGNAFDERIHKLRPHKGQEESAANLRLLLKGRENLENENVQDAYSLRCIPQVHGASKDALEYVEGIILTELNSITDNPIIIQDSKEFISCGNFHGQPLALAMDHLGIALSELASISERRIERLLNGDLRNHLPNFLVKDCGLNTGLMITQYTAAYLVSENKVLAHPASVDSIPTSAGQEDHVSMGLIAARKCDEIKKNVSNVLAIELLCAAQAMDFVDHKMGEGVKVAHEVFRKKVKHYDKDRIIYPEISIANKMIRDSSILREVEGKVGKLK